MSQFITRTPQSSIRALGSEAERSHARVSAILARYVSPQHAALLTDPVPVRDGTGIDWYVDAEGEVIGLSALPEADASAVRTRLAGMIRDVTETADRIEAAQQPAQKHIPSVLRQAVTFPGEADIWSLRTKDSLQPLLVGWGYAAQDAVAVTPFHVSKFAPPRHPAAAMAVEEAGAPVSAAIGAAETGEAGNVAANAAELRREEVLGSGPVVAARRGGGWLLPLLLSLFLLLLFALSVALLLPACGLRTPFGTLVFGLPKSVACTGVAVAEERPPAITAADLERELQVLREELLRRQGACNIAQAEPDARPAFEDVIDDRGDYQITLLWETTDDLDLHVVCPAGQEIHYRTRNICGGVLDIDANVGRLMNPPIENVTFHDGLGEGDFRVEVNRFNSRSGASSVPFRIRVRTPSGTREVEGVAGPSGSRQQVTILKRD